MSSRPLRALPSPPAYLTDIRKGEKSRPQRAPFSAALPLEVVAQNGGVVEAQLRPGHLVFREPAGVGSVVAALRNGARLRLAGVDRADVVLPRVALRVRIGEELADQLDLQAGLFARFASAGALERFAFVDVAAGDGPAVRRVLAPDEDDAAIGPGDDRIGGRLGVPVIGHERL